MKTSRILRIEFRSRRLACLLGAWTVASCVLAADMLVGTSSATLSTPASYVPGSVEGCAPARGERDPSATQVAIVRARASLARMKDISVGGSESLGPSLVGEKYQRVVREISQGFQAPIEILEQRLIRDEQGLQMCVLIIEKRAR